MISKQKIKTALLALAIANRYRATQGAEPVRLPKTDSRGFWYVPFFGQPGDLGEGISVADVLAGMKELSGRLQRQFGHGVASI